MGNRRDANASRACSRGTQEMRTAMNMTKALSVAENGPKTESQRQQAMKTLRKFAKQVRLTHPEIAGEARNAALRLTDIGDVNKLI